MKNLPIKNPPILSYTENSKFPPLPGHLALAWIDKKKKSAESRDTEDKIFDRYLGRMFFSCLESWSNVFQENCKSILFCAENHTSKLAEFLEKVETKLKIPAANRSQVFQTNNEKISAIRTSKFWLEGMRLKVFPLFIRASIYYESGGSINDAINKYPLAKKCLPFFDLFLSGYVNFDEEILETWKTDFHHGIIFSFQNKTKEQIIDSELLTKP